MDTIFVRVNCHDSKCSWHFTSGIVIEVEAEPFLFETYDSKKIKIGKNHPDYEKHVNKLKEKGKKTEMSFALPQTEHNNKVLAEALSTKAESYIRSFYFNKKSICISQKYTLPLTNEGAITTLKQDDFNI